ncbi:oligosaccharide flippase family protein [Methanobacterium formicicum]|uniref:Polysaccharide biosynthesis protein n=1 Tax=Methanobacterium formicicum (strain DSM 3637 / PP1) TaxID=1204725 RepID=K2R0G2_METFP|nr:oligosaccharide flippase family protein [Methanobacterium formicicum]EKF86028.1 polysaccharide biosynthesis protein [Methanobacterium formicicum DSM 3637]
MSESLYKKIIQDIGIVTILGMFTSLSGILLIPVITKFLGVENYGLYVQFTVTLALIMGFTTLGLPYATVRFLAGEKNRQKIRGEVWSSFLIILLTSLAVSLLIIIFSNSIANSLFGGLSILVIILAVLVPIECISGTFQNLFRVFQKIKYYSIFNIAKTYVEVILIIAVIISGFGIIEVALSILITRFIFLLVISAIMKRLIGLGKPNFSSMKKYLKFGLPTIPSNVASWINDSSDRYIITILLGIAAVGYYNPGYSIGSVIGMLSVPFDFVLVSIAAEYYNKGEIDLVRNLFKHSLKYYLLISVPTLLGISILANPILTIISTPEIAQQSYLVVPIVGMAMVLSGIGATATGKSLYLAQKNHITMINWFLVAMINIVLCVLLIPKMGILGAAIATLASFSFGFLFGTYFAVKYFDFSVDWTATIKIIVSSLVMALFILILKPVTLLDVILAVSASILVYLVVILATKTIDKKEINLFISMIKNR